MKTARPLLPALFTILAATGCAVDPATDATDETTSELTNGDPSADPAYVVEIFTPVGMCTANVISQHYLLTSAHCFASSGAKDVTVRTGQTGETQAYQGTSDVIIHPNWVDGAADREAWDIAVVRLHDAGMGAGAARIRIYGGPETPWTTTHGTYFSVSGYGIGSDAGGPEKCDDNPSNSSGTKRGGRFAFNGNGLHDGPTWFSVHGYSTIRATCHGDSGAGYRLYRNNEDFLFALHSSSDHVPGGQIWATMVQPKLAWIQARSSDTLGLPLVCSLVRDHRSAQEIDYYNCSERPRLVWPPPIDPGPIGVFQP